MQTLLITLLEIAATVLAADFVGGIIHWLEDAYVREDTFLIGKSIARPNIIHHHFPRQMTRNSWWESSAMLLMFSAFLIVVAWGLNLLTWEVWLFAILSTNANQIHKWEHQTRAENGAIISFLQKIRVLQTAKHHARHHTDPKNSHYCTLTNVLNPVLDGIQLWNGLEWLLAKTIGLKRREDTSVHGFGPGPEWLAEFRRKPLPKAA